VFFGLKPKPKSFFEPDVKIGSEGVELTPAQYQDWAGFWFDYPKELEVTEIELNDETVYSSLELTRSDGEKANLRVADSQYHDLDAWLKAFEKENIVALKKEALWVDIPAKKLTYGAPQSVKTVAIEDGVIYELTTPASEPFWEQTQKMILNSFGFSTEAEAVEPPTPEAEENGEVILLDEAVVE